MVTFKGKSLIAGNWQADEMQPVFYPFSPSTNSSLTHSFINASQDDVKQACERAQLAFECFASSSIEQRAKLLNTIADMIMVLGDRLLDVTHEETGLPLARLQGERGRTVNQLRFFAELLFNPIRNEIKDEADPTRQPMPKPATRLDYLPIGPVAVFGASNFPYAFSVAGGDTASALAAGCPVVVKGHPAHPGTSELMAYAIDRALNECELPSGIFSLLQSNMPECAHQLVMHDAIKAVGFTGSLAVAKQLQVSIDKRQERIPLYGELGSVNPQLVLPEILQQDGEALVESLVDSLLMGQGQFCTSPGIWLIPQDDGGVIEHIANYVETKDSAPLLTPGILNAFGADLDTLGGLEGVSVIGQSRTCEDFHATANIFRIDAKRFINQPQLQEEVFGPFALIVSYKSQEQLLECVDKLKGQLTASIHGTENDLRAASRLVRRISHRVGRLIFNQMPTGVEVCHSMNHGGPFPASTDVRTTSVGAMAMERYQRPICYQNMPEYLV